MSAVWNLGRSETSTFPHLETELDVDVVIVGGGITGLAAALTLCDAGERVAVLEAYQVGSGSTGNSTGNLYSTLAQGLSRLAKKWDEDTVGRVVGLRRQALDEIQHKVERLAIDCQFERRPLYFCVDSPASERNTTLDDEYHTSRAAGLQATLLESADDLGVPAGRALLIEDQAQFNPRSYCDGLAKAVAAHGGKIFENTPVLNIDASQGKVITPKGVVRAGHIVLATHTPKGINMLQAEMEPYREHGIAAPLTTEMPGPLGIFWMLDGPYSIRSYQAQGQSYLVVVGRKHKTGHDEGRRDYALELEDYARRHFPIGEVSHRWSAQQYLAADLLPYIGLSGHDNVYVATGYAADGLVWGELAARIVSHQILGRPGNDGELLNARRFTPAKSAKGWLEANSKVAKHLSTDYFGVEKLDDLNQLAPGEGRIVKIEGDSCAAYRSPEGRLSLLSPVCPHMKCMVHWNPNDSSWDCPCHGSRFDTDGKVLEGPALKPLEARKPPS